MRVLFLADAVFADQPGGAYLVADELARQLAGRGHEITFLVPRHNQTAPGDEQLKTDSGKIRIVRYTGSGNHPQFIREGRRMATELWKEAPFDVVHTHFAYAANGPVMAFPADTFHIRSFYGPWHFEGRVEDTARFKAAQGIGKGKAALQRALKWKLRLQTERKSLARSRAVIVLSEHSRREVLDLNYPNEKIHLVFGGVDTQRFTSTPEGRDGARKALNLPLDRPILFTVRRLAPRMGLDVLLEAMKTVVFQTPNVLLLIGGKGPESERLQRLVGELGLQNNVRLVGFIPDADLPNYYRAADLFVLPTLALEGFGLVTVETLACGTPIVATPIGATPEILRPLDERLLAKSTAPADIAAAINTFLSSSWREELTPQRLRDYVLSRYTWDRHGDAVEAIYRQLCT